MKFRTSKESLLNVLSVAQEVITNKSFVSILSNVYLKASGDTITVKATNSTVSISDTFKAEIEEEGEFTVFCDKFVSVISSLPSGEIEVFSDENGIKLKPIGKKIDFKIKSLASDKFPIINDFDSSNAFNIAAKELKTLIHNTVFAVSTDAVRYFMTGCYICMNNNYLTMVATDGRRLSTCKCNYNKDIKPAIVPTKILSIIEKYVGNEGSILVNITDKVMQIKSDNLELSSNLIEGTYPTWQKVLPQGLDKTVTVSKKDLEDAVKLSMIMSSKIGRIQILVDNGKLVISSSNDSEIGSSKEEIAASYNGEPVEIILNPEYLSDILKVINTDNISIDFSVGEDHKVKKALIVRESNNNENNSTHVIMPMTA